MQPIDIRKLEGLRRFWLLRAAYLGTPIKTSSSDRVHAASGDGTDGRGTYRDQRT